MKKFIFIVLVAGGGLYFQLYWNKRFDEKDQARKTAVEIPKAPPPKPPAPPARPDWRLPYPPTRAQLEAVIPDYAALEARIKSAAVEAGLQFKDEEYYPAFGQVWNALLGRGGTPSDRFKFEMNMFDVAGTGRDYDGKIAEERDAQFQLLKGGQRVYAQQQPAAREGVDECWEKIKVSRGTEVQTYSFGQTMTIGGFKYKWIKLAWEPEQKAWVRRTEAERRQFRDGYEKRLWTEIMPATAAKAAQPPNLKNVRDANSLAIEFRPAFEQRYLTIFVKEFRDIPWGAE